MRQMKNTVFLKSHDTHSLTFVVKISDLMDARKKSCMVGKFKKSYMKKAPWSFGWCAT